MDVFIGIDIGTTATKAVLFDQNDKPLAKTVKSYGISRDLTGKAEQNLMEILNAVVDCVAELSNLRLDSRLQSFSESGQSGEAKMTAKNQLRAISFSAQMHSLIALDENFKPLTNSITWADTRSAKVAENLSREFYERSGTPIHAMSPLSKIMWLKAEKPEIYVKTAHFMDLKGWIFHKFFGVNQMDLSIASGTGNFDQREQNWLIEAEKMPKVVSPYQIQSNLKNEFAKKMKIPSSTKFVWGAADGPLANLGSGAVKSEIAALTIGTSGAIRLTSDKFQTDEKMRTFTYALDEKNFVLGGAVNSGGNVLEWLGNLFDENLSDLAEKAAQISAGSDGLIFHPYLSGERAPLWNSAARASFFGLNHEHTKAHMVRAVMEGIIFNLKMVAKALPELTEIRASGGFTKSELWLQILADIFDKPVRISQIEEAGCFGAVLMAKKALKIPINVVKSDGKIFLPDEKNREVYHDLYEIFEALAVKFDQEYQQIADFQKKYGQSNS